MKAPKTTVTLHQLADPNWVGNYVDGKATNMDSYYTSATLEVEVLTIHFEAETMRVRYVWAGKRCTRDVSATDFLAEFCK